MPEVGGFSSDASANDGIYVVTAGTLSIDGGDGVDTLDFGTFEATWTFGWNRMDSSGSTYDFVDPATGMGGSVDATNVEAIVGSPHADYLVGNAQVTSLSGGAGNDTLEAAMDSAHPSYFRGGEGDDSIAGGDTFDNINGNQGADTIHGWESIDWVLGGQGNDVLYGDDGNDVVNGNLGDDTVDGGAGDDVVRGGQGDDSITGGAGNDWISGDRGADTIAGGEGADVFHSSVGAGLDVVVDFHAEEGDRVELDAGTTYTLTQQGADVVIDMGGGDEVILRNVLLSSLPPGWIFEA